MHIFAVCFKFIFLCLMFFYLDSHDFNNIVCGTNVQGAQNICSTTYTQNIKSLKYVLPEYHRIRQHARRVGLGISKKADLLECFLHNQCQCLQRIVRKRNETSVSGNFAARNGEQMARLIQNNRKAAQ